MVITIPKIVKSTQDFRVGDILECPHGILFMVTNIRNRDTYHASVLYSDGDNPRGHVGCAKTVSMPVGTWKVVPKEESDEQKY